MAATEEIEKEILAEMAANPVPYAAGQVNDVITIDGETRMISVPASEIFFGVESDKDVERKHFRCPKVVGDGIDLSKHQIYISYITSDSAGKTFSGNAGLYLCEDVATDGDDITFSWQLSGNVFASAGFIAFKVLAAKTDGENVQTRWNTVPAIGTVLMTVPDGMDIGEANPDIVTQLLERMASVEKIATEEAMQGYVNTYLEAHPGEIDETLTDPKKAAPASVVGELKEDISDLSNIIATKKDGLLCNGFAISTNYKKVIVNSDCNVVKVGIEPIKNKYLIKANKAPFMVAFSHNDLETSDITTSSIIQSESKSIIVDNDYLCKFLYVGNLKDLEFEIYEIKKSDIRDCVYPEYFGAKGDGITDDFYSLQSAIDFSISNNLKLEFIKGKTYAISKGLTINIPKNIYIDFNYAEIRAIANMQRMISIHCSDDIISSDTPTFDYNNIKNIRLNHNGYSGHSIYIDYGNNLTIDGVLINDCKGNAIQVEAGGINLNNGYIICKHGSSVGINISTSDSSFNDIIIIDADTAIYNSGTNFFTKIHGWNTQGGVEGTIFFSHNAGNAHLVQCQCDTYETGYYIGTDRRLSLTNCTYYFNSNVYKGNKTPIIFKYADFSRYYSRNTSCVNCTFDAFSTEVLFTNFNAMMINQVGCWYKGSISLSKSEIGLILAENVSDTGNAWNENSLQYKDDTVKVQLALNIDGKDIGTTEKSIGTIPQTYWYPTTIMCVPCMLFVDEWDTKWYMGYVLVNNNNGLVTVKAEQNLSYKKLLCNFEYDKPQVIYKG